MIDDATLLDRYARERSEEAFDELVQRHVALVYSAALRRTDGDTHRAKDVAQIVFTALARDAAALSRHAALTGWLYAATRNATIDLMRAERRRRQREQNTLLMNEIAAPDETPADWEQIRPVLDEAMDELDEREREAVLMRFFEGRPFAIVATALCVSEDTARKRVNRALDKLGGLLARRGITSTSGALAVVLANQAAVAVPAGVTTSIASAAVASASVGLGAAGAGFLMTTTKAVTGITAAVVLGAIGTVFYQVKTSGEPTPAGVAVASSRPADGDVPAPKSVDVDHRFESSFTRIPDAASNAKLSVAGQSPKARETAIVSAELADALAFQERATKPRPGMITAGKVARDFVRLFGLSPEQEALLNAAHLKAKREIDELSVANTTVRLDGEGKVTLVTAPYDGGQVYNALLDTYEGQLGKTQLANFLKLGATQLESAFDYFGAQARTITIERLTAADTTKTYKVADAQKNAGWGRNGTVVMSAAEFQSTYGRYLKMLPTDF